MKNFIIKKTLELGKVAYTGDRKEHAVSIDIEIEEVESDTKKDLDLNPITTYHTLSMAGNIWDRKRFDILEGGQCQDTIARLFLQNTKVQALIRIWDRWHLNDLKAGTRAQEKALEGFEGDYTAKCDHLRAQGLLRDRDYYYGSAWLVEDLPLAVIKEIQDLIK